MADAWKRALEAIRRESDFGELNALVEAGSPEGANASIEWDGAFLTPLFVATLLRLEDHLAQLVSLGADPAVQCFYEGLLCCPLHAAAINGDCETLQALLHAECDPNATAETSALRDGAEGAPQDGFVGCNALHVLVARDSFSSEVYRLLLARGTRLSASCRSRAGEEVPGLALPRRLGNREATEERLDSVIGEEVKFLVRSSRSAGALNTFLEMGALLKREHGIAAYRFTSDVDFALSGAAEGGGPAGGGGAPMGCEEEVSTAMLYAAEVGNTEALRLLLYAGASTATTVQRVLPFTHGRAMTLPAQAIHLAMLRGDLQMLEQLLFFGVEPATSCCGVVHRAGVADAMERWAGLSLMHVAVLSRNPELVPVLLKCECDIDAAAQRSVPGEPQEAVVPLVLAILLGDVRGTAKLLDSGAAVDESVRAAALRSEAVCEMFGGPPVVGLEHWVSALLTGDSALQQLIERRTDLCRALSWPDDAAALLERHRLASPELVGRLVKTLGEAPTVLRDVCPVHLACLLQQPWALEMLADAGAPVAGAPPCLELARGAEAAAAGDPGLSAVPLDALLLCVRVGGLQMLELLSREPRFALDVRRELALVPDLTPPFFPGLPGGAAGEAPEGAEAGSPLFAWCRLGPLELALLYRRVDVAVLLVRLGADLLHTVDHVTILPPSHYTVTDLCFRGLTPLHLCALLDLHAAAAALLNEGCHDGAPVVPNEHPRAQRKAMLAAVCVKAWATVDTAGDPEREPWLWRDLTPLHLAILSKSYGVAELLIDVATSETLAMLCVSRDVSGDAERSFSALLLAHEHGLKDLHRKIAKKFPTC